MSGTENLVGQSQADNLCIGVSQDIFWSDPLPRSSDLKSSTNLEVDNSLRPKGGPEGLKMGKAFWTAQAVWGDTTWGVTREDLNLVKLSGM